MLSNCHHDNDEMTHVFTMIGHYNVRCRACALALLCAVHIHIMADDNDMKREAPERNDPLHLEFTCVREKKRDDQNKGSINSINNNYQLQLPSLPPRLSQPTPKQPIRRHRVPIPQLPRRLDPENRDLVLEPTAISRDAAVGERMRIRQVLGQQAQLPQYGPLVPGDVLVV